MKKVLSIVLSLVMVLCMMPVMAFAATTPTYNDIAGEKCEASVELLTELGVVDGYEDGSYKPAQTVTRAEMAKLIVTALGLNPTAGTTSFTDMANAQWAVPCVGYAESLGIINGYGDGRFGPNDLVTYDQAITMIVRALGYTTDCNEMQGVWPAVYVQKANELGILKDVNTTGSAGANRGDIAIMLANALYVQMVYADNDGATIGKTDADGTTEVTMYSTLVKGADMYYGTVTASDTANATKNINELLGAAGKIVENEDGDVISVSDIKSTFMTGEFNAAYSKFTVDGVDYTVKANVLKKLNSKGNAVSIGTATVDGKEVKETIPVFENGVSAGSISALSDLDSKDEYPSLESGQTVTIAATVSGKSISGIFSVQSWTGATTDKVTEAQLAQIDKNKKLLTKSFAKDDNGDIDTDSFILKGVDSLDKITEDNIVYVYEGNGYITKVEVGTEVVSGEITRTSFNDVYTKSYVTIDGTQYKFPTAQAVTDNKSTLIAGNDVTLYLDYDGKIYDSELTAGTTGNYAVVLDATPYDDGALASDTKVQLLTADGVKVFVVDTDKVTETDYENSLYDLNEEVPAVNTKIGNVIKFTLNTAGEIKSVTDPEESGASEEATISTKVTAKGYLENMPILDGAVVFAAPVDKSAFNFSDTDNLSVLSKDSVLGKTVGNVYTYVANDDDEIEFLLIANSATSEDLYGVIVDTWSTADGTAASYYVGNELVEECEVDGQITNPTALQKITKNADGTVKFTPATGAITENGVAESVSGNKVVLNGTTYYLADDAQVYIYDASDDEFTTDGAALDMIDDETTAINMYKTAKPDSDNAGLVTYVVVTKK